MDGGRPPRSRGRGLSLTLLRPTPGRVWFRGGETGGQAVMLWWWLVVGGRGLKDEAAVQPRSGHGTRKRNVSSRHPANRRRCNPPLVSPESRGSLALIGFWFFFFLLMFASCRMLPS